MLPNNLLNQACLFCKIIRHEIPCYKLIENDHIIAFLDIYPLSVGHALIIPKFHAAKLHDIPDIHLHESMTAAKKVVLSLNKLFPGMDYNLLQNNGHSAHQEIDHVHFHIIPKPNQDKGLSIGWPSHPANKSDLEELSEKLRNSIN